MTRHFRFRVTWGRRPEFEREITLAIPACDCATPDQRDLLEEYCTAGVAVYYGHITDDLEGFSVELIEEFIQE